MQVVGSSGVTMTSNTVSGVVSNYGCVVQISSSADVTLNQNDMSGSGGEYNVCITNSNGVDVDANNIQYPNMGIGHIDGVPVSSDIQIRKMNLSF